jgi:hypothetical protein
VLARFSGRDLPPETPGRRRFRYSGPSREGRWELSVAPGHDVIEAGDDPPRARRDLRVVQISPGDAGMGSSGSRRAGLRGWLDQASSLYPAGALRAHLRRDIGLGKADGWHWSSALGRGSAVMSREAAASATRANDSRRTTSPIPSNHALIGHVWPARQVGLTEADSVPAGWRQPRGRSSIGRAPGLQPGGWRFDPGHLHLTSCRNSTYVVRPLPLISAQD